MSGKVSMAPKLLRNAKRWRTRFLLWQNKHVPQSVVLVVISLIIGVLTGATAAWLKSLIHWFSDLLLHDISLHSPNYRLLLWPIVGILITCIFQRYVVRGKIARGTHIIREDLDKGKFRLSPFMIFNPAIGCSTTIGFGSSGGSEGPTALCGSAIGSTVGRWFGLSDSWLRLLVGIGGGAGIAAIFKAPMGGVLFTIEVLQLEMTTFPVIGLILACLVASSTAYMLSDFSFDIFFDNFTPFDPSMLGWILLLGVFCGLYSVYYNYVKNKTTQFFLAIRNPWIGILVTGGIMSVCVFMFPAFYGEGFGVITHLVNGEDVSYTEGGLFSGHTGEMWMYVGLVCVLLLKGVLVSAAYGNGGVAGDFVPTFFAGALAGNLFCLICNHCFGLDMPVWFFSLVGMGAVMAGTIHAPLMSIFILCETTNTYAYLLPYMGAVFVSYAVVKLINPKSWYAETGHDDFIALVNYHDSPSLRSRLRGHRNPADTPKTEDKTTPDQK